MIDSIKVEFSVDKTQSKYEKIQEVLYTLCEVGIPSDMILLISSEFKREHTDDETISYVSNKRGIHFYYFQDLCSGGINFDFNAYKRSKL